MEQITFDIKKLAVVDIDLIRPNPWNPKDRDTDEYKQVKRSIELYGQRIPIIVRENNGYELIDGEQRWRACKELGFKKVIVYNEGTFDDQKAKELTLWYEVHVKFNEALLSKMVTDLMSAYPKATVPFNQHQLDEMRELAKFNWEHYKINVVPSTTTAPTIKTLIVPMTEEQYKVVQDAMASVRQETKDKLSDGRVLELICADYLAGAQPTEAEPTKAEPPAPIEVKPV